MGYSRSATARGTGYHLHLLRRALAAVVEGFVEADELDLVPADADSEPEAAARQLVERGRLLCDQNSLPLRPPSRQPIGYFSSGTGRPASQSER